MKQKKGKDSVEYSIEIPKESRYFFLVRKFMENILGVEKISKEEKDQIILAVNEACDKLLRVEPGKYKKIKINISVKISPKKITVLLHYKGTATSAKSFTDYSEEEVILEEVKNRIGDYLIESNTDEVSYTSSNKKGRNVKLVKLRKK